LKIIFQRFGYPVRENPDIFISRILVILDKSGERVLCSESRGHEGSKNGHRRLLEQNGKPPLTVPPDGDFVKDTLLRRTV